MQEQNFEKQVQQKMEEFSLTPSVPVWQKVEQEIQQKKRRRRIAFFWLIPFTLIGAGIILWNNTTLLKEKNPISTTAISGQPSLTDATSKTPNINASVTQQGEQASTINTADQREKGSANITHDAVSTVSTQKLITVTATRFVRSHKPSTIVKLNTADLNSSAEDKIAQTDVKPKVALQKEEELIANSKSVKDVENSPANDSLLQNNQAAETINNNVTEKEEIATLTSPPKAQEQQATEPHKDSAAIQKGKKKVAKWSFAVQASFGISSLQSDLLAEAGSTPQVRSDFTLSNGSGASPISPSAAFSTPSAVKKGRSYQMAFMAKRTFSKRIGGTIGLQYSQFTTQNKIGKSITRDTVISFAGSNKSIDGYYLTGPNTQLQDYTNRYHFLALPLDVEWQPLRRLPLRLQAGTHLSYLIATNGLVYDSRARIYYHNKDLYNKWQIHFNSGLTYPIVQKKHWGLQLGPYLQYGISNLQKDKVSSNYHLFATGIKTQLSF